MAVRPSQVFLVPGHAIQLSATEVAGGSDGSRIDHRVVVAGDSMAALALLRECEPGFQPLGATSLQAFRDAEARIVASLGRAAGAWPLLVAPGLG